MHGRAWRRAWRLLQLVVLIGLGAAVDVAAQQSATGTLTGTVVDSTKASVPGATASAIEGTTGAIRTGISNEQGLFRIPALPPGRYSLRVELSGFRSVTVTDILLVTTEVRDVGTVTLQLGEQTEEVTVTAGVTPVQVRSSSRYSTVMSEQLTNIQMKGRDIYGLMAILPGVQDTNLNRDFTTWTSMRDVTINGAPVVNKNIVVDGVSVVDEGGAGNAFVNPNIDAVGEVQVLANGFTAENGRNNGGLINMTVKSGTSELRGSGWYNARRDKWNANDYLRKREALPKPLYRVNISGYSVGGPVVIPKLFDSRKSDRKLFFFASQEYTDDARPSSVVRANLPTERERRGDFSDTRLPNGDIQSIIDPRNGQPFPGNIIPGDRIDPTGRALLDLLPTPNGVTNPVPGEEFTSNSAFDETPLHSRTNHVLRIDGVLSQTLRASFTFMRDREDNWRGSDFAPGLGWVNNFVPGWIYSGKLTHVL
ncbi:MAG: carboxypeptidase regulatory-like domain-containing protein, partial [Vicinamibacteraceae bacterium]